MAPKDYSRIHDPEAERTRAELWIIIAIVVVVILGALAWRVVAHKPAKPANSVPAAPNAAPANAMSGVPAAPAGIQPHPAPLPATPQ
ncbi:hypothetical protein [Caulobacter sp. S45]|uniref:hypothetical protein n=1 Tax=Caulobacter sp. S45 TaxID=1641861 RepID=UPI00131C6E44|nr:hypothetical protein [Caulobacter sp. S45]